MGGIPIAPATVLAPMAGVTDTVFRRLIRNQGGCGLLMTEFTSSHGVVNMLKTKKPHKAKRYLYFEPEEHPISAQLFGSDPAVMADAARICQDQGFDIVDINFGCPVNKVVKCNGGSGLLRDLAMSTKPPETNNAHKGNYYLRAFPFPYQHPDIHTYITLIHPYDQHQLAP